MAFRFLRLPRKSATFAPGWTKWMMAPALIGLGFVVYLLRTVAERRDKKLPSICDRPADELPGGSQLSAGASPLEDENVVPSPLTGSPLTLLEAELSPSAETNVASVDAGTTTSPVYVRDDNVVASGAEEIGPVAPPSLEYAPVAETWRLPGDVPNAATSARPPFADEPRIRSRTATRRFVASAAIIAVSAALVYAAVGAMRSHPKKIAHVSTPALDSAVVPTPDSTVLGASTSQPAPPSEGPNHAAPSPSATVAPSNSEQDEPRRTTHRRHFRKTHRPLNKPRTFLRKLF